jgi:hypothetical protein
VRERLGRLSDDASEGRDSAASLGRTAFDELARTLGRPASDLLTPVGELLEASLLVERGAKLAFWHDLTREAVAPASRSLPAAHSTARPPSSYSRPRAAVEVAAARQRRGRDGGRSRPARCCGRWSDRSRTAAPGQRDRDRAGHHPKRGRSLYDGIALHIAGNSEEAIAFADRALRETPCPPGGRSPLGIAGMFAISPEIRISAGRLA